MQALIDALAAAIAEATEEQKRELTKDALALAVLIAAIVSFVPIPPPHKRIDETEPEDFDELDSEALTAWCQAVKSQAEALQAGGGN